MFSQPQNPQPEMCQRNELNISMRYISSGIDKTTSKTCNYQLHEEGGCLLPNCTASRHYVKLQQMQA